MAFQAGHQHVVTLNEFDLSSVVRDASVAMSVATHDVTTMGDNSNNRHAGLFDGSIQLGVLFDQTILDDVVAPILAGAQSTDAVVVVGVGNSGTSSIPGVGDNCKFCKAKSSRYALSAPVGDMVTGQVQFDSNDGVKSGKILHELGAETSSSNSASVDHGAALGATSFGGTGFVVCTAAAGTTLDCKIEDSTNDSVWADLLTFTQLTAVGSEIASTGATDTVDRYLRGNWTIVGGSFTFLLGFARHNR